MYRLNRCVGRCHGVSLRACMMDAHAWWSQRSAPERVIRFTWHILKLRSWVHYQLELTESRSHGSDQTLTIAYLDVNPLNRSSSPITTLSMITHQPSTLGFGNNCENEQIRRIPLTVAVFLESFWPHKHQPSCVSTFCFFLHLCVFVKEKKKIRFLLISCLFSCRSYTSLPTLHANLCMAKGFWCLSKS